MAQMGQYIITLSLKSMKVTPDFILNFLKRKSYRGHRHHSKISKKQKPLFVLFAQILIKFKHIVSHTKVYIIIFKNWDFAEPDGFLQSRKKAQSN